MVSAYILLDIDKIMLPEILRKLDGLEEVRIVDLVYGEFNMVLQADVISEDLLSSLIEKKLNGWKEVRNSSVLVHKKR
jgi:hypothetical protein